LPSTEGEFDPAADVASADEKLDASSQCGKMIVVNGHGISPARKHRVDLLV
jgi:hypothetical protein